MASKSDLLQGTLDLLILKTLSGGPMHGWGVAQKILLLSQDIKKGPWLSWVAVWVLLFTVVVPTSPRRAVMAALEHRRQTGEGQYIDLSQAEASLQHAGYQETLERWDGPWPESTANVQFTSGSTGTPN